MTLRHITVLFTDIVGSTALAMAHSPEAADDIRRSHFGVLRQVIEQHGGEEVKNLGDGLMVSFDSASAALACAVAMQQVVDVENRAHAHSVGLRVGLSSGDVAVEDGDLFGDAVVESARLCAACTRGQILAAELVGLTAGRRNRERTHELGPMRLKGLSYDVRTIEVAWERVDSDGHAVGVPLPARLAAVPASRFVGRSDCLDSIAEAQLRTTSSRRREVVLIAGEAGLGKSTLAAAAARTMHDNGAAPLFGRCEEDVAPPYRLIAEPLDHLVRHAPQELLDKHVALHGSDLGALVPSLAKRIPDLPPRRATDSETERFLMFASAVTLLADASHEQPVVLVLDDLQWADVASLKLLRHIVASDHDMRLLILCTYRNDVLEPSHPLTEALAAMHREPNVHLIEPGGLSTEEVHDLLEATAGHELGDDAIELAAAVHLETGGNPFFVSEVLRHLAETGAIRQGDDGRWVSDVEVADIELPDSVRVAVTARLGRLDDDARTTLGIAAVIGRDFDLELLAVATGSDELSIIDILQQAERSALVHESADTPGAYYFSHALIQHVLYDDLGPSRRAATHRVVAGAMEQLLESGNDDVVAGELARHWGSTGRSGDRAKAVASAQRAGDVAAAALAPADALHWYRRATELVDAGADIDPSTALDLAIGLGVAQRQTGDSGYRETLLDAARRADAAGDVDRLARAALENNRGWFSSGGEVDPDRIDVLTTALGSVAPTSPERADLLGALCSELSFDSDLPRRERLANDAVRLAFELGDDVLKLRVLNRLTWPLAVPELLEQSLAWSRTALELAERVGDPVMHCSAAIQRASTALRAGDITETDRCYATAGELAAELDQPPIHWEYTFHRARRALLAGDPDTAEALAATALTLGLECGEPDAETYFGAQLANAAWQRGTMRDLAPMLEQMAADNPGYGTMWALLAAAYADADRVDDARAILRRFAADGYHLDKTLTWLNGVAEYAEAAIVCGDPVFAAPLYDLLVPHAGQIPTAGGVTAEGPVDALLGGLATVLGRYDDAEAHLIDALEHSRSSGTTFFEARAEYLLGALLLARDPQGDSTAATRRLEHARAIAIDRGYGGVGRRVDALLAELTGGAAAGG